MAEENQQANPQETAQSVFNIEKIYVKDLSLEIPNAPQVFLQKDAPQVSIELQNKASMVDDGIYDVVLTITVTAKIEDKVAFLVEVAQAGIFQVRNVPQEAIDGLMSVTCANILFPYAREAVSDMVTRAGFPPVVLNPINFEAIFMQQKQQQEAAPQAPSQLN
ncbi:MAG TPA: protein-export chaperone SecB [Methylophilaceae bacterium]|jgi:preprotein translocase subunit SecB